MLQASGSSANAPLTKLGAELLGVLASVMQLACALSGCIYGAPDTIRTCDLCLRRARPAVYSFRFFVTDGGLISCGTDSVDPSRQAAG